MRKRKLQKATKTAQAGFTIIEVMLAVAISALMLIGVIGGVYISINQQRYSDALRDFAEYMRTVYSEVISPQSLGLGNSKEEAVLGKVLVFGLDDKSTVYSATLVGNAEYSTKVSASEGFLESLTNSDSKVKLICGNSSTGQSSTLQKYTPLWQSQLMQTGDGSASSNKFIGTMIIARSLTSATVHTSFLQGDAYDLQDKCSPDNNSAGSAFAQNLKDRRNQYNMEHDVGICVKMDGNAVSREVRIAADGRNTSAVKIMNEEESKCR